MPNIDPKKRTHKNNTDICWNILDIIDDYVNFDYLNKNVDLRQAMYDELALYVSMLNKIEIDYVDSAQNNELNVTSTAIDAQVAGGDMTIL